ncbi:MAG: hypothetical protein ACLR30_03720 [[Clostridium] leptum]
MNKNQYVNSILKRFWLPTVRKKDPGGLNDGNRSLGGSGLFTRGNRAAKGEPELVAKEFNDSSSDPEAQRQYYLQRGLKIAVIVLLVSAVLLVLAGTALHYLPFWYTPPLTEGETVAIIGGADGPTSIFVTSLPKITGFAAQLLTLGCVLLALCLAALAAYWALRKRY